MKKKLLHLLGIEDESELEHLKCRIYDDDYLNFRGKLLRIVMRMR